jgi:hypothetical protein
VRALKVLVVVMGVMIVVGIAVVAVTIVRRVSGTVGAPPPAAVSALPSRIVLDQPPGTRIAGMAATSDRLAVRLEGGGPDRILLLDPRTGGTLTTTITLAH